MNKSLNIHLITLVLSSMTAMTSVSADIVHSCSLTTNVSCTPPGVDSIVCFCECLDVTVNRINLTISYFPCMELLEQCHIYELWFEIELHDENRNIVNATTVVSNYRIDNGSKMLFLHGLKQSFDRKLKLIRPYSILIQPGCTICDDNCASIGPIEIPVETSTSPINAKRNGPENLPIVPIILGILAVFVMAVNAFIIVFKWRRSARQLPANNIEYSSALQQVHMVNSRN
ncbi:RSE [Mytilus edulis]|uniref:TYRO3 n=1 Tax=Mytilus edulis TaxID=6550 RepID=A0A8S3TQI4_MYTED|nr:RSE [Mytilus edulis]